MNHHLRKLIATPLVALVAAPVAFGLLAAAPTTASAAATCDRYAADTGSDLNAGTQAAPFLTIRTLAAKLAPGQTGCIANGSTLTAVIPGDGGGWGVITNGGTAGSPITIRPEPGGTASFVGPILVQSNVHDLVLSGITFRSPAGQLDKSNLVQIEGDRITLENSDISFPGGICVGAGMKHSSAYDNTDDFEYADDLVLRGNRVHDCGTSPDLVWKSTDSGAHGVYLVATRRALVTENLIYRNKWRGLQTWPQALDTTITNNLFDGNAAHVNIGSALTDGYPWHSERATVRNNIMSNRVTTWEPSKNAAAIFGNYPEGTAPTQYGNVADGNCIDSASAPATGGNGISFGANTTGTPAFTNRAADDFRLLAGSPCTGVGPASIQPAVVTAPPARFTVTAAGATAPAVGDTAVYRWTVTNVGGTAAAAAATGSFVQNAVTPSARLVTLTSTSGTCTVAPTSCALPALAPGASVTVTATVDVLRSPSFQAALSVSATNVATVAASVSAAPTGTSCTIIGTPASDTALKGTAGDDVICGFAGNDAIYPGAGNDVVRAGSGNDAVSYAGQANGVVVNLGQKAAWDNGAGTSIGWDTFTSVERASGTSYADLLLGDATANTLSGGAGADQLWGYDGNDTLSGGAGADKLYGGNGNDVIDGGTESDLCRQEAGTGTPTTCELA